ncbi:3-oxoacyl-[acyl-carrier-protein] synthase 2 [Listeria grayi]|uniref:3-oxoacyl-[acyl-carrier-protein] synthase 2 n=1 Tax=Listeria grayi TaxID=1641 RepID=A0A378MNG5_LISGR|nr:3-oxoacyl-[acyl-carrier-protein] synthase 2 [Listeria grayi]
MLMPNAATANISLAFQAKGPTMSITSACATSNNSIGEAYRAIKYGFIDAAFAGGTEAAINEVAIAGFSNAKALSQNNEQPTQASRPFHKDRDGFVIAEGSTVLILESLASAEKRGAAIYAEVTGYGVASDAYHIVATDPEGKGAAKAMEFALEDAGITAEDIDVISAHATSTPVGDASEEKAIRQVFTDSDPLVTANKSMTGHMLGAAGAFEAFALAKCCKKMW